MSAPGVGLPYDDAGLLDVGPLGDEITVVYVRPATPDRPAEIARRATRPGMPDAFEIARRIWERDSYSGIFCWHWKISFNLTENEFRAAQAGTDPAWRYYLSGPAVRTAEARLDSILTSAGAR